MRNKFYQSVVIMDKTLFILVILFGFANPQESCPDFIKCEANKPESCPHNTFYREKVKVHGCCPGCVSLKEEGSSCLSPAECQPGLTCSSTCIKDEDQACEYYKLTDKRWKKPYWNPKCLPDGTFAPKQCKGEQMSGKCFCVNKSGRRIFGEEEWSKADYMNCVCSRLADEKKDSGVTFHCDHLGNFEPVQCNQKVCWCATPTTGLPYSIMVPLNMMNALPCYNRNTVGDQYHRQCDSVNYIQEVATGLLKNHGTTGITLTPQNCNFNGSYHRVQFLKEMTRCAFLDNFPLTEAVISTTSDCNCAYDRHVAQLRRIEFNFECHSNGNYRNRQTLGGKVLCVDEDGFFYSDDPKDCETDMQVTE